MRMEDQKTTYAYFSEWEPTGNVNENLNAK